MITQSTYSDLMPAGTPGMPVNAETWNTITRTAESAVNFGQPAFQGSNEHGAVPGATFAGTGVGAAVAGNVGTSTISASPTVASPAKSGRYLVTQLNTSATGALQIEDPEGHVVGHGNVGTAFTVDGITATVTSGGTATAGDQWTIDVTYTADAKLLGIVEKDVVLGHSTLPDAYAANDNMPIRTQGVIWVTAGATVVAQDPVYWNPATSRYTNTATHIRMTGWKFDSASTDGNLVKIAKR
jgi:hypothetical protein